MTALCFLDIESTSLEPDRQAWEVAMIRREDDGTEDEISFFIENVDLSKANPKSLEIGGYYERHPQVIYEQRLTTWTRMNYDFLSATPKRAAEWVEQYTRDTHIVGAMVQFDTECLDKLLRRHKFVPNWHYHLIEIEALMLGFLRAKGRRVTLPWKSDDLVYDLSILTGVDFTGYRRHEALEDTKWAMKIYDTIMGV